MTRTFTVVAITSLILACVSTQAEAQRVRQGTLSGTVVSASATVQGLSSTVVVTEPAAGFYILKQVCFSDPGLLSLSGSVTGVVVTDSGSQCTTYEPGIGLVADEELSCVNDDSSAHGCTVTGVVSKK